MSGGGDRKRTTETVESGSGWGWVSTGEKVKESDRQGGGGVAQGGGSPTPIGEP